ncbi:unnamed protein product [Staurois parvus]|uniref:Uncharacterized protein n=1 Tax=Staurois parvus TaxID=386267 RepID=A0ABN9F1L5_9NEOB|nr:unnamed protein product [Staurois parvus]
MILTLLTPAPARARSLPLPSTACIPGCSSKICTYLSAVFLLWPLSSLVPAAPSIFFDFPHAAARLLLSNEYEWEE